VPLTRTFEIPQILQVGLGYVAGYKAGWDEARTAVRETIDAVAEPIADANPLVSAHGVFRNDPTWDNFMQNIEEYRRYVNSLEE